jgi:hypothetical protein
MKIYVYAAVAAAVIIGVFLFKDRFIRGENVSSIDTLNAIRMQLVKRELISTPYKSISFFKENVRKEVQSDTMPWREIVNYFDTLSNEKLVERLNLEIKTIYKFDNRVDVSCREGITTRNSFISSPDKYIKSARTVCALIPKNLMTRRSDGSYKIGSKTLLETKYKLVKPCSTSNDVCFNNEIFNENIRYSNQKVGACCSGFGYKTDQVVTASHCFKDGKTVKDFYFVFGYCYLPGEQAYDVIPGRDVYEATGVVKTSTLDVIIIQMNRVLRPWQKAELDPISPITTLQPIYMAGHPDGLPLKLTLDATADFTNVLEPKFQTDLDAFHGNSGSPVFNNSGRVIGILLEGNKDDTITLGCARYYKSPKSYGETVLKASFIH